MAVLVPPKKQKLIVHFKSKKKKKKKNHTIVPLFWFLHWEKEEDYRKCRDSFCVLKCSGFFHELQIQTISCAALRCFPRMFAFPAPCVEEEKQEGKTEHKLSDAWTYEYLSVNASRWTSRPRITQTECPGRVPYLLGDLYDHEMISRQDGFGGNRSICLRTDGAETVYDRSHHMCQNPICQQLKWQHIRPDLFPSTLCAAGITHGRVAGSAALLWCRNTTSGINGRLFYSETSRRNQRVTLACQNNLCWRTQCDMQSVWDYSRNGEFNHHIINGFGVQPVIHDSVLYGSGSTRRNEKVVEILCAAISSTEVD